MIDREQLHRWWETFVGDGNFTEIRILGRFQYSGYFKDFENLCKQIEPYTDMEDEQIYFILNEIDPSCYGRQQCEKIIKSPKITTNDGDIIRRKWILLDFDPVRRSGTNSTDEMLELAHKKAQEVFIFLRDKGFSTPVICKSGNGWHLLLKVDFEVSDEVTDVVKRFLKYLGSKYTDEKVDFDEKNFNNARVSKLYSTIAKKGANIPEMPWRKSEIVYIPENLTTTPFEKIKEIADLIPKEEPKTAPNRQRPNHGNTSFDLRSWLDEHGIEYKEQTQGASIKFALKHCPWEETHSSVKEWESALFLAPNGQITFSCFHSHCKDKTWFDFREHYEPDAYNRPAYQPQQVVYVQQSRPQRKKYEVKDEIPELGEKWMSLSSVQKIDLTKLEKVKTGFTELDKSIGGLYMSEMTILSGSNASGKSSWLNSVLLNIIQQGYKVALWSGELRSDILKTWIHMVAAGAKNVARSQYDEGRYYVPENVSQRIDQWLDGKFFLYNNEYGNVASQMLNDIKILADAGVKIFALDNMMSMNIDVFEGDKNDRQKALILALKEFAMREQVHIILVAHPRKSVAFLRKTDISGSGDIINAVDNCFIYHRVNEDFIHGLSEFFDAGRAAQYRQFGNVLAVEKNRMMGVVDYMVGLHYEIESRRFKNTPDEDIHYGWEDNPMQSTFPVREEYPSQPYYEPITEEDDDDDPLGSPEEEIAPF